jgi:hypothetical protein
MLRSSFGLVFIRFRVLVRAVMSGYHENKPRRHAKGREENMDINTIVDASRFDSSNPTGESPVTGLDKSSPYNGRMPTFSSSPGEGAAS